MPELEYVNDEDLSPLEKHPGSTTSPFPDPAGVLREGKRSGGGGCLAEGQYYS